MTGHRTEASVREQASPALEPADLVWRQGLDIAPGAQLWLGFSSELWRGVGKLVLASAGLDEFEESDVLGTFQEVLQQAIAPVCTALGAKLGHEVTADQGERVEQWPSDLTWVKVEVVVEDGVTASVWVSGNTALLDALHTDETRRTPDENSVGTASPRAIAAAKSSRTLDLLMEVELPVGVSFGRAQMRLKDAIKLTTGSIVELNRSIVEPVEIIVNNCVIARGEVVVVEGNYGVRIQEIISREERLRTLF
jgi:flagellar motor switch protein FliN/FliY